MLKSFQAICIVCLTLLALSASAQIPARVLLSSRLPSQGRHAEDQGPLNANFQARHMTALLAQPADRQGDLAQYLTDLQQPGSAVIHKFLKPSAFAQRFGAPASSTGRVAQWLQINDLQIDSVGSGGLTISFSGSAAAVERAFGTSLHTYQAADHTRIGNASSISVDAAIAPLLQGVLLNNFGPEPLARSAHSLQWDRAKGLTPSPQTPRPQFNQPSTDSYCHQGYCFGVTAGDAAVIYNTKTLLAQGINGAGVTIGVVGTAPIDTSVIQTYRANFVPGYASNNLPTVITTGGNPTLYGSNDQIEAYLDLEVAGGLAPNAKLQFYTAEYSSLSSQIGLDLEHALADNTADVISISYGACEAYDGTYNAYYSNLMQQAAAQGITVVVSSGDSGSANCDPPPNSFGFSTASQGLAVNGLASTPYTLSVGGTDFVYPAGATLATLGQYWNQPSATNPNNNADWSSAKGYIPEKVWNVSDNTLNQLQMPPELGAGGGGFSACSTVSITTPATCVSGYPRPSWQNGFWSGPTRAVPDVSLFASAGGNYSFTVICLGAPDCATPNSGPNSTSSPLQVSGVGGTSVSAPTMAGIVALAIQKTAADWAKRIARCTPWPSSRRPLSMTSRRAQTASSATQARPTAARTDTSPDTPLTPASISPQAWAVWMLPNWSTTSSKASHPQP